MLLVVVLSKRPVPAGFLDNNSRTRFSAAAVYNESIGRCPTSVMTGSFPFSSLFGALTPELITFVKERLIIGVTSLAEEIKRYIKIMLHEVCRTPEIVPILKV